MMAIVLAILFFGQQRPPHGVESYLPEYQQCRGEDQRDDERDVEHLRTGGKADGDRAEEVDGVVRILERAPEPDGSNDAGQAQRRRDAPLDHHENTSDQRRKNDDAEEDGRVELVMRFRAEVDAAERQAQDDRAQHRHRGVEHPVPTPRQCVSRIALTQSAQGLIRKQRWLGTGFERRLLVWRRQRRDAVACSLRRGSILGARHRRHGERAEGHEVHGRDAGVLQQASTSIC